MQTDKIIFNVIAAVVLIVVSTIVGLMVYDIAYGERKPATVSTKAAQCEIRGHKGVCVKWK